VVAVLVHPVVVLLLKVALELDVANFVAVAVRDVTVVAVSNAEESHLISIS
jgi:hypothetical protein